MPTAQALFLKFNLTFCEHSLTKIKNEKLKANVWQQKTHFWDASCCIYIWTQWIDLEFYMNESFSQWMKFE